MAAIFIVAGIAIAEKMEKKRIAKQRKKAHDEARYRELQIETNQRLTRRESANGNNAQAPPPVLEDPPSSFDENPEEEEVEDENLHSAVDESQPPAYEDAVAVGERREREWRAQMERRRSSVYKRRSNNHAASPT